MNARALRSIGREIEELLRISREAGEAAYRLIVLLDLGEPDPDLEPSLGSYYPGIETGDDRERDDADDEPSIGWSLTVNQASPAFFGPPTFNDAEDEHDGREPDVDDEDGHDEEGVYEGDPDYMAVLTARREHWDARP